MPNPRVARSLLAAVGLLLALAAGACAPQASPQPAPTTAISAIAPTAAVLPPSALSATVPANTLLTSTPASSATRAATPAATLQSGAAAAAAATSALPASSAATPSATSAASAGGRAGGQVALLLPETKTARYESADRPYFEKRLAQLCPDVTVIYSNANQDANAQLTQAEAAIANGAGVLVLDPVDSAAAGAIATRAKAQGVPVIAYDRLILNSNGVNYYVSFDNQMVGQLQARSLVTGLLGTQNPQIVMINGSPKDNNAKLYKAGAHSVFDPLVNAGSLKIAQEYDTPDWSQDQAQSEMTQAIAALGGNVDGVYAANDATASGAIAALKAAKMNRIPPVTGQDAELAAIQRLLKGEQYMTVYKAIQPQAETAAQLACDLVKKRTIDNSIMTAGRTINNGTMDVPAVLLPPVAVTKDNIKNTVIQGGFWTAQQICTPDLADACKQAGLQ